MVQEFPLYRASGEPLAQNREVWRAPYLSTEGLIEFADKRGIGLPKRKSIKGLSREDSKEYQDFALEWVKDLKGTRGQLDLVLWRRDNMINNFLNE
jgi:hypothetical protein